MSTFPWLSQINLALERESSSLPQESLSSVNYNGSWQFFAICSSLVVIFGPVVLRRQRLRTTAQKAVLAPNLQAQL